MTFFAKKSPDDESRDADDADADDDDVDDDDAAENKNRELCRDLHDQQISSSRS